MKLLTPKEFNSLQFPENTSVKSYEACIDILIGGKSISAACETRHIIADWEIKDLTNIIEMINKQLEQ